MNTKILICIALLSAFCMQIKAAMKPGSWPRDITQEEKKIIIQSFRNSLSTYWVKEKLELLMKASRNNDHKAVEEFFQEEDNHDLISKNLDKLFEMPFYLALKKNAFDVANCYLHNPACVQFLTKDIIKKGFQIRKHGKFQTLLLLALNRLIKNETKGINEKKKRYTPYFQ